MHGAIKTPNLQFSAPNLDTKREPSALALDSSGELGRRATETRGPPTRAGGRETNETGPCVVAALPAVVVVVAAAVVGANGVAV